MSHYKEVIQYCRDIKSGRIKSGAYTKKAIERFMNDIKKQDSESFPYKLINECADEVIDFAESLQIPDINTEDKRLRLLPWMKFVYYNIYGWRHKNNDSIRRFRFGYVEVARKNSKTTSLLFPFILYDFLTTESAESYFVSKDQAQSSKSYKELSYIIKADKEMSEAVNETTSAITLQHSRISFFSSESAGIDSYKNSLSIIDEYHAYDNDKIVTAFKYGGRARDNSLVLIITSAGNNISGPCYAENERCRKILNNVFNDDTYFGLIYAYDEKDDWKDPSNFIKANPSLHTILKEEILVNDLNDALSMPSHQPDFQSKTCGIWTSNISTWIPIHKWERNKKYELDENELLGKECIAAFDLSHVNDFTAYTKYFKLDDGKYYAKHKFYIPEAKINEKYVKENINLLSWIQNQYVTATPGETIDFDYLYNDIIDDSNKYKLNILTYDRWGADHIIKKIETELPDTTIVAFNQNEKMIPSTAKYEKMILDGMIVDNNPVMTWMIGNSNIKEVGGSYKIVKPFKSSTQKIDGVITSIMALAFTDELNESSNEYTYEYLKSLF